MFTKSADIYDDVYSFVDYEAESQLLRGLIMEYCKSGSDKVLDVACGTGQHIAFLRKHFDIQGLDIESGMLEIAREKNPGIRLHQANMIDFDIAQQFDAILCMFSSIGFVKTTDNLRRTAATLSRHLKPGGVLIVEPWVTRDAFIDGHLGSRFVG